MSALEKKYDFFSLIKFTAPTITMMIFMSLYTMVDGVFISNMVGKDALSSINLVYPAQSIIIAVSIMLATGGSAIIASNLGEKKFKKSKEDFTFLIIVGLLLGILFAIIGTVFINPIIDIMGATESTRGYCFDYLYLILLASPLAVLQMMFQYLFVTAGKPHIGLTTTVIGGILNIVLDYLFIGPLNMGITGAAIATSIGYSIPALYGLFYFTLNRKGILYFVKPVSDFKMLIQSCFNGSSEMITNLAGSITVFLFNMVMLKYMGVDGVAAITFVMYAQFLLTSVFMGFSSGVAPLISYNYGNKNYKELKKIHKYNLIFISVSSIVAFILSILLADSVTQIFVKPGTEVFNITKEGFLIYSISYLIAGFNIYTSSLFTALSNGLISAIISFLRTFFFLSISILGLPMIVGKIGIWFAVPVAELLTVVISVILLVKNKKKYNL